MRNAKSIDIPVWDILPTRQRPVVQFALDQLNSAHIDRSFQLISEASAESPDPQSAVADYLMEVLKVLSRAKVCETLLSREASPHERHLVNQAKRLVLRQLDAELKIAEVANGLGVSAGHLRRVFHKVAGYTLQEYVIKQRMRMASELLAGGATVTAAAVRAGYCDVSSFTKVFRDRIGVPPSHFSCRH
jgi:AraC-like DNA-binding protein